METEEKHLKASTAQINLNKNSTRRSSNSEGQNKRKSFSLTMLISFISTIFIFNDNCCVRGRKSGMNINNNSTGNGSNYKENLDEKLLLKNSKKIIL